MRTSIAVFHFSPLELFPPAMNFLGCLEESLPDHFDVIVYTTWPAKSKKIFETKGKKIRIKRLSRFTLGLPLFSRVLQYVQYHLRSFFSAIIIKPSKIIYFETISAFVPYIICKWFYRSTGLFIHYHEYMTPQEYNIMFLNRNFHKLERKIYPRAKWISHTNRMRMQLFLEDLENPLLENTHIFPNFPPAKWKRELPNIQPEFPLRIVHVGSLGSIKKLYIREVISWIRSLHGQLSLDLYSMDLPGEIKDLIESEGSALVRWKGPADYGDLPKILQEYQVGLIMYKGADDNTSYSAPNKLFEYLVCGLDVWYPLELKGTYEYDSSSWPKTLRLDFRNLAKYDVHTLLDRRQGEQRNIDFTCEHASSELISMLFA